MSAQSLDFAEFLKRRALWLKLGGDLPVQDVPSKTSELPSFPAIFKKMGVELPDVITKDLVRDVTAYAIACDRLDEIGVVLSDQHRRALVEHFKDALLHDCGTLLLRFREEQILTVLSEVDDDWDNPPKK